MEMPPESASSDVLLDTYGVHHEAMLAADPRTSLVHADFAPRQEDLRTAMEAREAAERALVAAEALRARAEIDVETIIRKIDLSLLGAVNKKRDADPYRRVLPANLEGALRPVGAAQAAEGVRIADLVAPPEGTAPVPGLPGEAPPLGVELRAACVILDERSKAAERAAQALDAAFLTELSERRRWREQYRKSHGRLTGIFGTDSRTIESFFKKPARSKKKKDTTTTTTEPNGA